MKVCLLKSLAILPVAMLALLAPGARAEDTVTLHKNGEKLTGRIKSENIEAIEVEIKDPKSPQGGAIRKLLPGEVAEIEWGISTQEWRDGFRAFRAGAYSRAADNFSGILTDKETLDTFRAEAKPYLQYMYAESLFRAEKSAEAVKEFEKFMADYKSSTYSTAAVGSLVDASVQSGDFGKVPNLLADLRKMGGEQKAMADYYEGKMMLAQKKVPAAEQKFGAAASGSSVPSTKGMALMGQAQCAVENKDVAKARDLAQRALGTNPPRNVAGAAHLVIGETLLAEVDAQKPTGDELVNKLMDALLAYMRVHLQYDGDRSTEPRAMYRAGECLQRLSKLPNRGADRQRSITMYSRLTADPRYRNTEDSKKAADAIRTFK